MILYRLDYSHQLGGGHFSRCLALSKQTGKDACFLVKGDPVFLAPKLAELKHVIIPQALSYVQELGLLDAELDWSKAEGIFFDIAHKETYAHMDTLVPYLEKIRQRVSPSILIDGMLEDSLLHFRRDLPFTHVATPYAGAKKIEGPFEHIYGPEYFILSLKGEIDPGPEKQIRAQARNILITMGQSDPTAITTPVLGALLSLPDPDLRVRVIVGPLFSEELKDNISRLRNKSPEKVELVHAPPRMLDLYHWSDLTIASTGLTKYELALTGTPAVLISLDSRMAKVHEPYEGMGVSLHLGSADRLSEEQIAREIGLLCANRDAREKMSKTARKLIDGKGAIRLLDRIFARR